MDDVTTYAEATYTETMHIAVVPGTRAAMHRFMIPPKPMETSWEGKIVSSHAYEIFLFPYMHG